MIGKSYKMLSILKLKFWGSEWDLRVLALTITAAFTCTLLFQLLKYGLEFLWVTVWVPWTVTRFMRKQGYAGPPFNCYKDNSKEMQELTKKAASEPLHNISHDIESRICAPIIAWQKRYGKKIIYHPGGRVQIFTSDAMALKEMFYTKSSAFEKCPANAQAAELLGTGGLVFAEHEEWFRQRRAVRPTYYGGRSKEMVVQMTKWIDPWLDSLEKLVVENGDGGPVSTDMVIAVTELTKDILARSSFGSNFEKGREGFENQDKLKVLLSQRKVSTNPLLRWLTTSTSLEKEIRQVKSQLVTCLQKIVDDRRQSTVHDQSESSVPSYGEDLLGCLLADSDRGNSPGGLLRGELKRTNEHILDQCRVFFFAGAETVSVAILWAIVLLGHYSDWQDRIRAEGMEAFQGASIDGDRLVKLKQLDMFVQETLRLYPPAPFVNREVAKENTTLLGEPVPRFLSVHMDFLMLHRRKEYWGDDALEFNPDRFTKGVAGACKKGVQAFAPFGFGPRTCVAQAFATTEVKLVLTMLLQRFSFRLSPSYRHEVSFSYGVVRPKFGVQVILERL